MKKLYKVKRFGNKTKMFFVNMFLQHFICLLSIATISYSIFIFYVKKQHWISTDNYFSAMGAYAAFVAVIVSLYLASSKNKPKQLEIAGNVRFVNAKHLNLININKEKPRKIGYDIKTDITISNSNEYAITLKVIYIEIYKNKKLIAVKNIPINESGYHTIKSKDVFKYENNDYIEYEKEKGFATNVKVIAQDSNRYTSTGLVTFISE